MSEEGQVSQPVQIALNAGVVHEAYEGLKKALTNRLEMELALNAAHGQPAKVRDEFQQRVQIARAQVEIAKTEVDRVMALVNYFQMELMYRSAIPPQPQAE